MAGMTEARLKQLVGEPPNEAPALWTTTPPGLQSRIRALFPDWIGGRDLQARRDTKWTALTTMDKLRAMYQFRLDRIRGNFITQYITPYLWPNDNRGLKVDILASLVKRYDTMDQARGAGKIQVITEITRTCPALATLRQSLLTAGPFTSEENGRLNYQDNTIPFAATADGDASFYQLISCFYNENEAKDCTGTTVGGAFAVFPRKQYTPETFSICFDAIINRIQGNQAILPPPQHPDEDRCAELNRLAGEQTPEVVDPAANPAADPAIEQELAQAMQRVRDLRAAGNDAEADAAQAEVDRLQAEVDRLQMLQMIGGRRYTRRGKKAKRTKGKSRSRRNH